MFVIGPFARSANFVNIVPHFDLELQAGVFFDFEIDQKLTRRVVDGPRATRCVIWIISHHSLGCLGLLRLLSNSEIEIVHGNIFSFCQSISNVSLVINLILPDCYYI